MDRRAFSKTMIGAGLGAPLIGTANAWASDENGRRDESSSPAFGRIRLQIAAATIILTWLILLSSGGPFGLNLRRQMPQYPASRLNARRIPLLGGNFREPLAERFAGATLLGNVFLLNQMLIMVPLTLALLNIQRVIVTHRNLEYAPAGRPAPVRLQQQITPAMFRNRNPVGAAFLQDRELLVLVRPSILDGEESYEQ